MEKKHGSLLRAMMKRSQAEAAPVRASLPVFHVAEGWLKQLTDALVAHLRPEALRAGVCVQSVTSNGSRYKVLLNDGSAILADFGIVFDPTCIRTASFGRTARSRARLPTARHPLRLDGHRFSGLPPQRHYPSTRRRRLPNVHREPRTKNRRVLWSSEVRRHRASGRSRSARLCNVFIGGARRRESRQHDEFR